jgi:hypothetical protein
MEGLIMRMSLILSLLLSSPVAAVVFLLLCLDRGFDASLATFERFAEDVLK